MATHRRPGGGRRLCGLDGAARAGGAVDTDLAAAWLNDGIAPNGLRGRAFGENGVHGFDLTFAAPKSVSLLRVLTDPVAEKVFAAAHEHAIGEAMAYLHQHAGYTRVHNPVTGMKDLVRLPGLVGIAYQHETSRCGDPHLHTHVIVPNRQGRADGVLVSVDSKSLYHEAKAAGMIYQATLRHELHAERGFEWQDVDPHSGMAEIAGVTREDISAWSRRSTRLREWARQNLVVADGEPSVAQLAAAQKATRPVKPESLSFEDLKRLWRGDARGLHLDRAAHYDARARRTAAAHAREQTAHRDVRTAHETARTAHDGAQTAHPTAHTAHETAHDRAPEYAPVPVDPVDRASLAAGPLGSIRPGSPARTWSNCSARCCPSTRRGTPVRSSKP
nr:MobF family relaxase [Mycolicibacterium sp.]